MSPTRPTHRWVALGLVIASLLGAPAIGCTTDTKDDAGQADELSAIALTPLTDEAPLRLGGPSDLPMVLNVWATWCVPCRKEMPAFDRVATKYNGRVRFVGVNLGDEPAAARKFVDETGVSFDQYIDPDSTAQTAFSLTTMPATAFLRADGTIATTRNGALDESDLEALIESSLMVDAPRS